MNRLSNNAIRAERPHEAKMSYMLLILEISGQRAARTPIEGQAQYERMVHFSEDLKARGLLTVSQSLKSDTGAVRVRAQGDQTLIVDGPFAESKELIGGFFLLTCETREQAVAVARECPASHWATVEVRELGPCFA